MCGTFTPCEVYDTAFALGSCPALPWITGWIRLCQTSEDGSIRAQQLSTQSDEHITVQLQVHKALSITGEDELVSEE